MYELDDEPIRGDVIDALFEVVNAHPELTPEVISALAARSEDSKREAVLRP
jgi:hypothetical protein